MPPPKTIDLVALAKGTFKRLAWAYASSRKGSEQEAVLERMLRDRVMAELRVAADKLAKELEACAAMPGSVHLFGSTAHMDMVKAITDYRALAEAVDPSTAPR